jgi:hypothetical protein
VQGGDAEVGQHRRTVGPEQHIGGLDVAVQDARRMGGAQRGEHAPADPDRLVGRERAAFEAVGERTTGYQLHDQPRLGLRGVHDVVDGHHVRMVQAGQRAGLTQGPFPRHPRRVRIEVRGRDPDLLERHLAVQHRVAGPPHRTHAPDAEPLQQFEAAVDQPLV